MIREYWKSFLSICAAVVLLGGVVTVFGVEISNPFVMKPTYTEHVVLNAKKWLRYYQIRKADWEYRIYKLEEQKKRVPRFMFEKLNYHIEQIRRMREKVK